MKDQDFPVQGVEMSVLLVVGDLDRARAFYRDVLGATEIRQYGGTSAVMQFEGTWLVLVTGGGPTPDKPTITFRPPTDEHSVSHELTIKVPDCWDTYQVLVGRGAEFLSPPVEYEWEVRCFFRDPDGHLLEISQTKAEPTL